MLEIKGLSASAGTFRLSDIYLTIGRGDCHAVLGPSGSGKSTLLNTILGVRIPESGSIQMEGVDITALPIERRGLGYVPQHLGLFPHLSVLDNLAYSVRARGIAPEQSQPLVEKLIAATGIESLLERWPITLSGGERQRVGLVRALASQPRLVLLDEPFTGLNEALRREMWAMMRELQRDWQLTVLIITHDLAEAYALANRVTILLDGRVVQQGDRTDVYSRPATREVARFLGVENLLPGRVEKVSDGMAIVAVGTTRLNAPAQVGLPEDVLVSIRSEEVSLFRDSDTSRSGANILAAQVVSVQPGRPLLRVELDAGFPLVAAVTRPESEGLKLRPGARVKAMLPNPPIHLIASAREPAFSYPPSA